MVSRNLPAFSIALCSAALFASLPAQANTLLTKATLQRVQNRVDLTKNNAVQAAKRSDTMVPGDALRTYQSALADLKFNDNSLARIGQQAIFRFRPNTRSFELKNGTALFLIRPGQGTTKVRTPNATAGIRGSALIVRYIEATNATMIGALTNSDIEVVVPNCGASKTNVVNNLETEEQATSETCPKVVLKAGQMAVVYQNQLSVYPFDQRRFQETSPFFKGIDWNEAPIAVKAEIETALAGQASFGKVAQENPAWLTAASELPDRAASMQLNPAVPLVPPGAASVSSIDRAVTGVFPASTPAIAGPSTINQPPIVASPPVGPGPATPVQPPAPPPAAGPIGQPIARPEPSAPVVQPPSRPEPTLNMPAPVAPPVAPITPPSPIAPPPSAPIAAPLPRPEPVVTPPTAPVVTPPVVSPPSPPVAAPPVATPPVAPPASPVTNNTPAGIGGQGASTAPLDPPAVQPGIAAPGPSPNASPAAGGGVTPPGATAPRPEPSAP